jgi:hypothetical protein
MTNKISKSELKTIIRETLREELEKLDPFFNKETGERLFVAEDTEGDGILAAMWAKDDTEFWRYFIEDEWRIPDQMDRFYIMPGEEYYDSFEEFVEDFPDLADGEGAQWYGESFFDYTKYI